MALNSTVRKLALEALKDRLAERLVAGIDGYHFTVPRNRIVAAVDAPETLPMPNVKIYFAPDEEPDYIGSRIRDRIRIVLNFNLPYQGKGDAKVQIATDALGDLQRAIGRGYTFTAPRADGSGDEILPVDSFETGSAIALGLSPDGVVDGYLVLRLELDRDWDDPRGV
jgi:hypothetical protein